VGLWSRFLGVMGQTFGIGGPAGWTLGTTGSGGASINVPIAADVAQNCGTVQFQDQVVPAVPGGSQSLTPTLLRTTFCSTTAAAAVLCDTVSVPATSVCILQIFAWGRVRAGSPDAGNGILLNQSVGYENVGAGPVAFGVQGGLVTTPRDVTLAACTFQFAIVGNTVTVSIVGIALNTIDWSMVITVRQV